MPLTVSSAQMMAPMSPWDLARWYVADIMPNEFPDFFRDLGPVQCAEQSRNALYYAEHFSIRRPDLQAQFLTLAWALGPNFFEAAAFQKHLSDPSLSEEQKIDALYSVSDEDGGKAMISADDLYWFPWEIENNILGLDDDPEWV